LIDALQLSNKAAVYNDITLMTYDQYSLIGTLIVLNKMSLIAG